MKFSQTDFPYNSPKWIIEICQDALRRNYIDVAKLWHVMGHAPQYNDLLPMLWKKYQLDQSGQEYPGVDSVKDRVAVWFYLFERFTKRIVGHRKVKDNDTLPMYCFNESSGGYEICDPDGGTHVSLCDLTRYFENIEPLPSMLTVYPFDKSKFSGLDIAILREKSKRWITEYPTIKRLVLYRASERHRRGSSLKYFLCAVEGVVDQNSRSEIEDHKEYMNWHWESAMHVIDDLADAYPEIDCDQRKIDNEWAWFPVDFNEPFPDEFIILNAYCNLYPVPIQSNEATNTMLSKDSENSKSELTINDAFQKFGPEVEVFYSTLKKECPKISECTFQFANEVFQKNLKNFSMLKSDDLNKTDFDGNKVERGIKGGLLRRAINRTATNLYAHTSNLNTLYCRYLKYKRSIK